ncbi:MAG: hypothetical protein GX556_05935 [Fibrobacter sp.]|nr:hypothetical protein [Fibrobacter sp.]
MKTMVLFLLIFFSFVSASEQNKKLKVAILNLKNTNGVSEGESGLISDRLRNEFFSTGMVDVMERDQMQEVLKEQGFQHSGTCTDEGCMVEIGRMLGVQMLVTGSIGKLGSMFMVNVRSVNIETGKFEKVISEDVKGDIENVVEIIPVIARRITGSEDIPVKKAAVIVQQEKEPPKEQPEQAKYDELPCNGSYYLQRLELRSKQIGFELDSDEKEELEENLAEVIGEAMRENVIPAEASQISNSSCNTSVIRIVLNSYRKSPAGMGQFEGTASLSISIYQTPSAAAPLVTVNIERTGERHWGDETPFLNAFEEIIEDLEDDFRSKVKKFLK